VDSISEDFVMEDHLVQNPQLNIQYQDSIGNNNSSSSELLNRLLHGHQHSQNDTSLESSRSESLPQNEPNPLISVCTGSSNDSQTNVPNTIPKVTRENEADPSSANYSNHKNYRIRC
jgi:hypothetical protein